jgi:ferredoxin
MTHIITALCLRDSSCVEVCPVECIIGGQPTNEWPWFYIDPDTCIDCGACVPECPFEAIFPEEEVPSAHVMKADAWLARVGEFSGHYEGKNEHGDPVVLDCAKQFAGGETVDLTPDIQPNYDFKKVRLQRQS